MVSTKCNGVECPHICDIPGAQIGGRLGRSEIFSCDDPQGCSDISLQVNNFQSLVKALTIDEFEVGSVITVDASSFPSAFTLDSLELNEKAFAEAYAYTTVIFTYG